MSIWSDIGNVASSVVNTVGDVASGAAHLAEGAVGEVAQVGSSLIGGILKVPGELLSGGFSVLTGAAQSILGELGGSNSAAGSAGGSISDKIFALMQQLQGQLSDKVNSFDSNASPTDQQKALFDIQQLQSQISQLSNEATNIQKKDDDTKDNIVSNFR